MAQDTADRLLEKLNIQKRQLGEAVSSALPFRQSLLPFSAGGSDHAEPAARAPIPARAGGCGGTRGSGGEQVRNTKYTIRKHKKYIMKAKTILSSGKNIIYTKKHNCISRLQPAPDSRQAPQLRGHQQIQLAQGVRAGGRAMSSACMQARLQFLRIFSNFSIYN